MIYRIEYRRGGAKLGIGDIAEGNLADAIKSATDELAVRSGETAHIFDGKTDQELTVISR